MWVPLLGLWGVISYAPLLMCRQYASEQFVSTTHGLNQLEFTYGDPGYAAQLAKLSRLWSEPQWIDLARHGNNIAPSYMAWNSNRARDVVLSARDDSVHPACPLPERMPTGKNGQSLVTFLEEARNHYEQVKAFYGYN